MSNNPTDPRHPGLQNLPTMQELLEEQEQELLQGSGNLVEGVIAKVDDQFAYVDVGLKSEGTIPLTDFDDPTQVEPGAKVHVMVLRRGRGGDGEIEISKRRADQIRLWKDLKEAAEAGATISGIVRKSIKGGLLVEVGAGVEGFLPASLVDLKRVDNLLKYVGQELELDILEVHEKPRRKVVFSRKSVLQRNRREKREDFLGKINVGDALVGTVKSIAPFGVFVDLGEGLQGLVHTSNLSWFQVDDPKEVVQVGQEVQAKVIHLRKEEGKISLSIKATTDNPMMKARELFPPGSDVVAKVKSQTSAGVTLDLPEGYEGFCPSDELAPEDEAVPVINEGEEITFRVVDVRLDTPLIRLSLRRMKEDQNRQETAAILVQNNDSMGEAGGIMADAFRSAVQRQQQTT